LKESGSSAEEINDEVAIIRAQLAFIKQRQGKEKEATELYEEILKTQYVEEIEVG